MNIYLVRHGETEWNHEHKIQGRSDIPLNEYGRELAKKTAEGLKDIPFDYVFSSPLIRARETAKIITGNRPVSIETDDRLMEMSFGDEEGQDIIKMKEDKTNPMYNFLKEPKYFNAPPHGESFQQVYHRSNEFMQDRIIPLEKRSNNILIVAHGALNRTIINPILNIPIERFWEISLYNCSVSILKCINGVLSVEEQSKKYYDETKP